MPPRKPSKRKMPAPKQAPTVTLFKQGAQTYPAVDVRIHTSIFHRLPQNLQTRFMSGEDQDILTSAYETLQHNWWDEVPRRLADEYLVYTPSAYGAGATGYHPGFTSPVVEESDDKKGFVVVKNIGLPADWTEDQTNRWFQFEAAVKQSIEQAYAVYANTLEAMLGSKSETFKLKGRFTGHQSSGHGHRSSAETLEIAYEDRPCQCLVPAYAKQDCSDCGGTGRVKNKYEEDAWCECVEYVPKAYCDICGGTGIVPWEID